MAITLNTTFRPFTYDEMIKPLMQLKESYDKDVADYTTLSAQAEQWKDEANQAQNPEAYEMYRKYAEDFNKSFEDLLNNGMSAKNKSDLTKLKRRYTSEIAPIAKAAAAMKEANDLRVKAGPDAIFEVGNYNSLDNFLHGKTANNAYISKEALLKRTAMETEAAMNSAMNNVEFRKVLGNQYWEMLQHNGGSYEDLRQAIANNPAAQSIFSDIKRKVLQDIGYARYDTRGRQAIEEAVNAGLYAGLDKPTRSFQANQGYLNPLQAENLRQSREEFKWKQEAREPMAIGDNEFIDPVTGLTFTKDASGKRIYDLTYKKNPNTTGRGSSASGSKSGAGGGRSTSDRKYRPEGITVYDTESGRVREHNVKGDLDLEDYKVIPYEDLSMHDKDIVDRHLNGAPVEGVTVYRKHGHIAVVSNPSEIVPEETEGNSEDEKRGL